MHTFLERLRAKGIRGPPDYSFGEFQKDSVSVRMAYYNTPVQAVVNQIMKESDNLNAEAMLCCLGAQSAGNKYVSAEDGLSDGRSYFREEKENILILHGTGHILMASTGIRTEQSNPSSSLREKTGTRKWILSLETMIT